MKQYSQLQQIISILITFIFLTEITGCSSTRAVQTSEFAASDKYIIHTQKTTYPVDSIEISNGLLSGKLDFRKNANSNKDKIHIYLSTDSALRFNNELVYVKVDDIAKVERKVPDPRKTRTLTTVLIATVCVGAGVALVAVLAVGLGKIAYPDDDSTGLCTNW